MTVTGTAAADTISLSVANGIITANVNGNVTTGADSVVTDIVINAQGGSDSVSVNSTGTNTVTVNAGAGNDSINITPASQHLGDIDGAITVNGDADNDTLTLFDNLTGGAPGFDISGTQVARSTVPTMTYGTLEGLVINAGVGDDLVGITGTASTAPLTFNAGAGDDDITISGMSSTITLDGGTDSTTGNDAIDVDGTNAGLGVYLPSATTQGDGTITFGLTQSINFAHMEIGVAEHFVLFGATTPNSDDALIIGTTFTGNNQLLGSSGGTGIMLMNIRSVDTFALNTALNDAAGSNDTINVQVNGLNGIQTLRWEAGGGANSITFNGASATLDTSFGAGGGANVNVINNNTALTFKNNQTLNRLEINSGGSVNFVSGSGVELSTRELAVTAGTGTIDTGTPSVSCPGGGTFSIGAGCTLIKKGTGQLGIAASQSHGAGSTMTVQTGILNFTTDAGSPSARNLSVISNGITNFQANQHLNEVIAADGIINMVNNGARVLVCSSVSTGSEGGAVNLGDNDMIVDYSGASPLGLVQLMLRVGRSGGAWNGLGINSSAAGANPQHNTTLGLLESTEFKGIYGAAATFDGQVIDTTALLVKYTYYGDTDFNGKVNFDDYVRTDAGFNNHRTGWLNGDFDFNNVVNFDDYVLIDLGFNTQGAALRRGNAGGLDLLK
jgi:hypothetical protein